MYRRFFAKPENLKHEKRQYVIFGQCNVKTVPGPSLLGPLLLKSCMIRFSQYVFLETTSTLVHCRKLSGGHQVILILTAEKTSEPEKFLFDLEIVLSNT